MTTYWVDKDTGDNGNSGTAAGSAWATIAYAVTQVSSNTASSDTIRIVKGATAYDERLTTEFTNDHSSYPHTLISDASGTPAVITPTSSVFALWDIDDTNGWVFDNLSFNDTTGHPSGGLGTVIRFGNTATCGSITFQNCRFYYSTRSSQINLKTVDGLTVDNCHLRDCRSRVAGEDAIGIVLAPSGGIAENVTITNTVFEDIGADGVVMDNGSSGTGWVIQYCTFGVNRPYTSTGVSFYNGDITTWQNFSTNVSENGIDNKTLTPAQLTVQNCAFWGFRPPVAGQDASGGRGPAITVHTNAGAGMTLLDSYFYNNGRDVNIGTPSTALTMRRCFLHSNTGYAIIATGGTSGVTVEDCVFVDQATAVYGEDTQWDSVQYNVFESGTYTRSTGNSGDANWDYNLVGTGVTIPADWQGASDVDEADETPVEVEVLDTLTGKCSWRHHLNRNCITVAAEILQYHPNLSDFYSAVDLAFLASSTVTVAQETSTPLRFSMKVEQ